MKKEKIVKIEIDPYADWEIAYQEEIHRADEWLKATPLPTTDRRDLFGETPNWDKLAREANKDEGDADV